MVVSTNNHFSSIAWCSHSSNRGICYSTINLHFVLILFEQLKKAAKALCWTAILLVFITAGESFH
jgi:hypothetical protein